MSLKQNIIDYIIIEMDLKRFDEISKIIEKFCELIITGYPKTQVTPVYYKGKRHYKVDLQVKLKGNVDQGFMNHTMFYSTWFCDNSKIKLFDLIPFHSNFSLNYYFGFESEELQDWAKIILKNYVSNQINCEDEYSN